MSHLLTHLPLLHMITCMLVPLIPGTTRRKVMAEYTVPELASHCEQTMTIAIANLQSGMPVDDVALGECLDIADRLGDAGLKARVESTIRSIERGALPQTVPAQPAKP